MISFSVSSQTVKENLDKLAKDRSTKDKADKADVLIQKKVISDPAQMKVSPPRVVSKTSAATNTKERKKKIKKKRKVSK